MLPTDPAHPAPPDPTPLIRRRSHRCGALLFAGALVLGACGGSADNAADGVASLAEPASDSSDSADETSTGAGNEGELAAAETADGSTEADPDVETDPEEAALAFAQCLRDGGLEVSDPTVDADGQINIRDIFESTDVGPRDPEVRELTGTCRELLEGSTFGRDEGQREVVQEAMLEFTECLRDQGLDVGDFQIGEGGPGAQGGNADGDAAQGGRDGQGAGPGQVDGGGRENRLATALGLDPEDPATSAAIDACDDGLAELRQGQPGA